MHQLLNVCSLVLILFGTTESNQVQRSDAGVTILRSEGGVIAQRSEGGSMLRDHIVRSVP